MTDQDDDGEQTDSTVNPPSEAGSSDISRVDDDTSTSLGTNVNDDRGSSSSRQYQKKRQHSSRPRHDAAVLTTRDLTACNRSPDGATVCVEGRKRCTRSCTACVCGYENSLPECTNSTYEQRLDDNVFVS